MTDIKQKLIALRTRYERDAREATQDADRRRPHLISIALAEKGRILDGVVKDIIELEKAL
jgi:hypothetical protein